HIVIGHEDTHWLDAVGAPAPPRTRADALAFATKIWQEAAADPDRFGDLIVCYSEHPDRVERGEMGTWSVREPTHYPRGVQALRTLKLGGVHAPIESHLGFEIIQRTEAEPQTTYAMEAIKIAYQPGDAAARKAALGKAEAFVAKLGKNPSQFDALRRQ